jgi:heptosyltransferase-2
MLKLLEQKQNIFIRVPNWVGDMVMAMPFILQVRKALPGIRFIGVGKGIAADIFKCSGTFDAFIAEPGKKNPASIYRHIQKLRNMKGGAALLYTNSLSSALEFFLAGVPVRAGYAKDGRRLFLTHSTPFERKPMDQQYGGLNRLFGLNEKSPELCLFFDEEAILYARKLSRKHGIDDDTRVVGFNPGAGYGATKKWPREYFVQLAHLLMTREPQLRFYVFGGPGEEDDADFICQGIGEAAVNIAGANPGLHNLKAIAGRLSFLLTNDSGLRWYGVALQIPTFVLFGGSDPYLTTCFMEDCHFLRKPPPCAPCKHRVCPKDFSCMKNLLPEIVFQKIITANVL